MDCPTIQRIQKLFNFVQNLSDELGTHQPDIIVVNYKDKPSHRRITAQKIKERKMTSKIPVYFIDGMENEEIREIGTTITTEELKELVKK